MAASGVLTSELCGSVQASRQPFRAPASPRERIEILQQVILLSKTKDRRPKIKDQRSRITDQRRERLPRAVTFNASIRNHFFESVYSAPCRRLILPFQGIQAGFPS